MKITIPKHCNEDWDSMTPNQQGKLCQICSKTVHDFSKLSYDTIIDNLSLDSNICIYVTYDQLDRNLTHSYLNSLFSKFAVGFILTSAGLISVNAQQATIKSDSSISKQIKGKALIVKNNKIDSTNSKLMIRGEVASAHDNDPPLYILDGKIVDEEIFKQVNQKNIKKIKVLKGLQATALYGTIAKNGALVIITKRAKR